VDVPVDAGLVALLDLTDDVTLQGTDQRVCLAVAVS